MKAGPSHSLAYLPLNNNTLAYSQSFHCSLISLNFIVTVFMIFVFRSLKPTNECIFKANIVNFTGIFSLLQHSNFVTCKQSFKWFVVLCRPKGKVSDKSFQGKMTIIFVFYARLPIICKRKNQFLCQTLHYRNVGFNLSVAVVVQML